MPYKLEDIGNIDYKTLDNIHDELKISNKYWLKKEVKPITNDSEEHVIASIKMNI